MIKNFYLVLLLQTMTPSPICSEYKNEGHVVESLKKHLTGIIKETEKKELRCITLYFTGINIQMREIFLIFLGKIIFKN